MYVLSHVQAEHVRTGQADACILSAMLTQQVLVNCTVAQLASDVLYLQQAAAKEHQAENHVATAFYQQLLTILQVTFAPLVLVLLLQCLSANAAALCAA